MGVKPRVVFGNEIAVEKENELYLYLYTENVGLMFRGKNLVA